MRKKRQEQRKRQRKQKRERVKKIPVLKFKRKTGDRGKEDEEVPRFKKTDEKIITENAVDNACKSEETKIFLNVSLLYRVPLSSF